MAESVMVLITCKSGEGSLLAHSLVTEGLAACVNILPGVTSIFTWNNAVQTETEELLLIKTSAAAYKQVEERVKQLHSYDVPEILSLAIRDISKPYQDWLLNAVTAK
jgi:periplasmic divalent cation tolerance protein